MAGFGRAPFGRGPFGRSATGKDLIVESFPDEYFDDSLILDSNETLKDNNKDPLLMVLQTYANSIFQRRLDIERMPDLIDYEQAPLEIVRLTGDMLGIAIDKNDPAFLQRTLLGSASQWLQIKSSKQGYSVRGLASGFAVTVDNFWRLDLAYLPLIPPRFRYFLVPKDADPGALPIFHTDMPPGTFVGTPTEEDFTYAKSAYVRVVFEVAEPRVPFVDYNTLLDLVIDKIRDVVGIHHELQAPQFLVKIPVDVDMSVEIIQIDETSYWQISECYIFDITAADVVPTDQCRPTITITTADEQTFQVSTNFTTTWQIDEDSLPDLTLTIPFSTAMYAFEVLGSNVEAFYHFDITPADVMPLDNLAGLVDIEITEQGLFEVSLSPTAGIMQIEEFGSFSIEAGTTIDEEIQNMTNLSTNFGGDVTISIIIGP